MERAFPVVLVSVHLVLALALLAVMRAPLRPPGPVTSVDDRAHFACIETGCWFRVVRDYTWASLAAALDADEAKLRAANPQISSLTGVSSGALILISNGIRSRHAAPK